MELTCGHKLCSVQLSPACKVAFLATPYVRPPTMPATWVPWPKQSSELPSPKLEKPDLAREPVGAGE